LPIAGEFFLKKADEYEQTVIVMYKLRFLEAKQAVNTIRMFLAPGRPLTVDDFSNSIIFAEDSGNARTIVNILKALDMNIMKELGMEVIPLQSLSAEEAATSVDALLGKMDVFKAGALQANVAVLPLQHFGGVLVLAQDPEVLSTVKNWLRALDLQGAESGDQIHVYYVQNSLAVEIASILGQMYGMEGAQATGRRSDRQLVGATGRDRRTTDQTRDQRGDLQQQRTGRQQQQTGGAGGAVTTTMTGAVIIVPDETNNAIVVRANQVDYAKIKKSILALDIVPRGVLIEVMIAEVRLTDELQYGVEWLLKRKGMDIGGREGRYTTMLDTGTQATVDTDLTLTTDAAARGLSFFWGSVDGDISALINLLGSETDVTILSNPTLLATDNKEASITVGGREPIVTQQATDLTGDTSTIVNSVQYEETGIILSVIPHINAGGLVRMEVEQTIRDAVANTISGIDSPRFTERKINTTMIAQNGNTVVIGGIIQTTNDKSNTGVPYLNKIPILSPLFSSKSNTTDRTELIIAITPRVVTHDRRDTTSKEFYERLMQLKRRIEREGAGGI
jgi:general secretion pathway protein D